MTCIAPRSREDRTPCPEPRLPGSVFCRGHELAPAAQRGGWLSAERRRRRLGANMEHPLDASSVTPQPAYKLWIGSHPPTDRDLPDFDVIALCAAEHQPALPMFHGRVIRCAIEDSVLDNRGLRRALVAARYVRDALKVGQRVLVTCHGGLNRSPLIAGLALAQLTRLDADAIVRMMRSRRHPQALTNPHFLRILQFAAAHRR